VLQARMSPVKRQLSQVVRGFSCEPVTVAVDVAVLVHVRLHFDDTLECHVPSLKAHSA